MRKLIVGILAALTLSLSVAAVAVPQGAADIRNEKITK